MTMKAVKQMTIGRKAEGTFGFEVDGEVTRLIFTTDGKGHNVKIEVSKTDLLAALSNIFTTAPAPVVEAAPVDTSDRGGETSVSSPQ